MTYLLLAASFALVLGGALLFTNAVEWAGHELGLGTGAVGSVLAAVATALPESSIPVVAVIEGSEESKDVAIGSIIGAPFMLATIAMALVGVAAYAFRETREQDEELQLHRPTLRRDLLFFFAIFAVALGLGALSVRWLNLAAAPVLVAAYLGYAVWTVRHGGRKQSHVELSLLHFHRRSRKPSRWRIGLQLLVALAMIVLGAELFVEEITVIAEQIGVPALVLALVIAPLATELPEKINSFVWMRDGQDALALGNITGAMVFQSAIPVAIGLLFTDWALGREALAAGVVALAGGAVALWAGVEQERFGVPSIAAWSLLFGGFVLYVAVAGG